MNIWNISSNEVTHSHSGDLTFTPEIRLWKLEPGKFKVIEQGSYSPILSGPEYTLLKAIYTPLFIDLIDQAKIGFATIYDSVYKSENHDYIELISLKEITPESIHKEDSPGLKLWTFQGSLFVSDNLKQKIEEVTNEDFQFHLGFQFWGG